MLKAHKILKPLGFGVIMGILTTLGCSVVDGVATGNPTPPWVVQLIEELEAEPMRDPPASVERYSYRADTVYYVPPFCCDMMSVLYDVSGEIICLPDGGIEGGGDGRCPDFFEQRSDAFIVWEDPRWGGN